MGHRGTPLFWLLTQWGYHTSILSAMRYPHPGPRLPGFTPSFSLAVPAWPSCLAFW